MVLVVTEKNDAAQQIARLLSTSGKPKADKVYDTPVYRFTVNGEEWVTIGLRGHIMAPDFPPQLLFNKKEGWYGLTAEGEHLPADLPASLERPPYKSKRKPFLADGVDIKGWKVPSLPYLVWAPIEKLPAEKEIIRALNDINYAGPLSVEWEDQRMDRWFGAKESFEYVKKVAFPKNVDVVFDAQFAK